MFLVNFSQGLMSYLIKILLIIIGFLQVTYAQNYREKLIVQRREQSKKIAEIHRILGSQQEKKYHTVAYLNTLSFEIRQRTMLLDNLYQDLPSLKQEIATIQAEIDYQQRRLNALKKEYAQWMYVMQKTRYGWGNIALIFSSENLRQFVQRIMYLQQYQEEIKREVLIIEHAKSVLAKKQQQLAERLSEQEELIRLTEEQTNTLLALQDEHRQLLASLQKNIPELEKQLKKEQKILFALEQEVNRWVENQPQKEKTTSTALQPSSETDKRALSRSFAEMKGHLPFPLRNSAISSHFGKQPHPVLPKVYVENLGIDLRATESQEVYPVLEGEVLMTNELPELSWMVIVSHGDYYSVYAKMERVFVKKGQKVTPQTVLGIVARSEEGFYDLQFQIWKGQQKLDPEEWLEKNNL